MLVSTLGVEMLSLSLPVVSVRIARLGRPDVPLRAGDRDERPGLIAGAQVGAAIRAGRRDDPADRVERVGDARSRRSHRSRSRCRPWKLMMSGVISLTIWLKGLIEPAVSLPWSANQSLPSEAAVIPQIRPPSGVSNSVTVGVAARAGAIPSRIAIAAQAIAEAAAPRQRAPRDRRLVTPSPFPAPCRHAGTSPSLSEPHGACKLICRGRGPSGRIHERSPSVIASGFALRSKVERPVAARGWCRRCPAPPV